MAVSVTVVHPTPADGTFSAAGEAAWEAGHTVSDAVANQSTNGSVSFKDAALATTATTGFLMIPSMAGVPTGVPASIPAGQTPVTFDNVGLDLYGYLGGSWTPSSPGVDTANSPAANEFARFTDADTIEGRTYAEAKSDLSLNLVENTALSTWAGTTNLTTLGTIATGVWSGTAVAATKGGTGLTAGTSGGLPYYSSTTTIASSALLGAAQVVLGGGAGAAPNSSADLVVSSSGLDFTKTGNALFRSIKGTAGSDAGFVSHPGGTLSAGSPQYVIGIKASTSTLTFLHYDGTTATTDLVVSTAGAYTFTLDVTVPDEAYGAGWNGSLEVPTKNAVYDKIEALDNTKIAVISFIIDGGGAAITTGVKGDLEIPFAGAINRVTLLADQSGSIVVDIWKDTYANYPPTVADTITASAKPTISTATKSQDATLTGWTTAVAAGDTLRFNVDSITTCTRVLVSLKITKT